jgi:putative selenium metabolism hydrolase
MREKILRLAESLKADLGAFLQELIAIESLSGKEALIVERVKRQMVTLGYDDIMVDPMGNLMGRIGSGVKTIAIDGHCDTVGIGNPEQWQHDPLGGVLEDGIIYGRGASDQKGGLASAVYAGWILKEIGIPSDVTLWVVASILEEDYEGLCWRYILEQKEISPDAVLLTEPSNLAIAIGQRGRMEIEVTTQGVSCHGSAPERGVNAIYRMAPIIQEIEQLNLRLRPAATLGKGSVTVTEARSLSPSRCAVPDRATIHLDRRLTDGEDMAGALKEIEALSSVRASGATVSVPEYSVSSYTGMVETTKAYCPMWLMDESDPLVVGAVAAYTELFGVKASVGAWAFSTNGVATMGECGIPTIGLGPGAEEYAHSPADQVAVDQLVRGAAFYAHLALRFPEMGVTRK